MWLCSDRDFEETLPTLRTLDLTQEEKDSLLVGAVLHNSMKILKHVVQMGGRTDGIAVRRTSSCGGFTALHSALGRGLHFLTRVLYEATVDIRSVVYDGPPFKAMRAGQDGVNMPTAAPPPTLGVEGSFASITDGSEAGGVGSPATGPGARWVPLPVPGSDVPGFESAGAGAADPGSAAAGGAGAGTGPVMGSRAVGPAFETASKVEVTTSDGGPRRYSGVVAALRSRRAECLVQLVRFGHLHPNAELWPGSGPPLLVAVANGHSEFASALLEQGADPNAYIPETGTTPVLMAAALDTTGTTLRHLLEAGGDVRIRDRQRHDAFVAGALRATVDDGALRLLMQYLEDHGMGYLRVPRLIAAGNYRPFPDAPLSSSLSGAPAGGSAVAAAAAGATKGFVAVVAQAKAAHSGSGSGSAAASAGPPPLEKGEIGAAAALSAARHPPSCLPMPGRLKTIDPRSAAAEAKARADRAVARLLRQSARRVKSSRRSSRASSVGSATGGGVDLTLPQGLLTAGVGIGGAAGAGAAGGSGRSSQRSSPVRSLQGSPLHSRAATPSAGLRGSPLPGASASGGARPGTSQSQGRNSRASSQGSGRGRASSRGSGSHSPRAVTPLTPRTRAAATADAARRRAEAATGPPSSTSVREVAHLAVMMTVSRLVDDAQADAELEEAQQLMASGVKLRASEPIPAVEAIKAAVRRGDEPDEDTDKERARMWMRVHGSNTPALKAATARRPLGGPGSLVGDRDADADSLDRSGSEGDGGSDDDEDEFTEEDAYIATNSRVGAVLAAAEAAAAARAAASSSSSSSAPASSAGGKGQGKGTREAPPPAPIVDLSVIGATTGPPRILHPGIPALTRGWYGVVPPLAATPFKLSQTAAEETERRYRGVTYLHVLASANEGVRLHMLLASPLPAYYGHNDPGRLKPLRSIDFRASSGATALTDAALCGAHDSVVALLTGGANPSLSHELQPRRMLSLWDVPLGIICPLNAAALQGGAATAGALLVHGANPGIFDVSGTLPLLHFILLAYGQDKAIREVAVAEAAIRAMAEAAASLAKIGKRSGGGGSDTGARTAASTVASSGGGGGGRPVSGRAPVAAGAGSPLGKGAAAVGSPGAPGAGGAGGGSGGGGGGSPARATSARMQRSDSGRSPRPDALDALGMGSGGGSPGRDAHAAPFSSGSGSAAGSAAGNVNGNGSRGSSAWESRFAAAAPRLGMERVRSTLREQMDWDGAAMKAYVPVRVFPEPPPPTLTDLAPAKMSPAQLKLAAAEEQRAAARAAAAAVRRKAERDPRTREKLKDAFSRVASAAQSIAHWIMPLPRNLPGESDDGPTVRDAAPFEFVPAQPQPRRQPVHPPTLMQAQHEWSEQQALAYAHAHDALDAGNAPPNASPRSPAALGGSGALSRTGTAIMSASPRSPFAGAGTGTGIDGGSGGGGGALYPLAPAAAGVATGRSRPGSPRSSAAAPHSSTARTAESVSDTAGGGGGGSGGGSAGGSRPRFGFTKHMSDFAATVIPPGWTAEEMMATPEGRRLPGMVDLLPPDSLIVKEAMAAAAAGNWASAGASASASVAAGAADTAVERARRERILTADRALAASRPERLRELARCRHASHVRLMPLSETRASEAGYLRMAAFLLEAAAAYDHEAAAAAMRDRRRAEVAVATALEEAAKAAADAAGAARDPLAAWLASLDRAEAPRPRLDDVTEEAADSDACLSRVPSELLPQLPEAYTLPPLPVNDDDDDDDDDARPGRRGRSGRRSPRSGRASPRAGSASSRRSDRAPDEGDAVYARGRHASQRGRDIASAAAGALMGGRLAGSGSRSGSPRSSSPRSGNSPQSSRPGSARPASARSQAPQRQAFSMEPTAIARGEELLRVMVNARDRIVRWCAAQVAVRVLPDGHALGMKIIGLSSDASLRYAAPIPIGPLSDLEPLIGRMPGVDIEKRVPGYARGGVHNATCLELAADFGKPQFARAIEARLAENSSAKYAAARSGSAAGNAIVAASSSLASIPTLTSSVAAASASDVLEAPASSVSPARSIRLPSTHAATASAKVNQQAETAAHGASAFFWGH